MSRRRKKDYVKQLEDKVDQLESQIIELNRRIEQYKIKLSLKEIGEEREVKESEDLQDLLRIDMKNVVQNEKEESRQNDTFFKLLKHYHSLQGPVGVDRIKLIK
uniref:BZIP domain-containing protein n=1 Tax=Euplotes harpa TaxID=151035 RepID=A0A7S3J6G8_9SPIT|mmetsp:Transcript_22709/g.26075  ORF Transcript_22709/g.26075 Transcript_22709/m.26075 type:complete len:104 (+) Transcript_22709:106-417(+)